MPSPDENTPRPGVPVTVRRAPKYAAFATVGVAAGLVLALVSAYTAAPSPEFTPGTVFGFLAVFYGLAGLLLASIVFLVVNRATLRGSGRRGTAVPVDDDGGERPGDQGGADRPEDEGRGPRGTDPR